MLDDIGPEYEELKSPEVRKNRPGELGNKLPSIDGTEQSSSNIKKIANGALVIETRQKPKRNSIDPKTDKQDNQPNSGKGDRLGYEVPSRRGKSQLDE